MSINQTFNSYKHRMRLDEMYYTEIEMEGMKEILRDKEEYIKKLEEDCKVVGILNDEIRRINEKLREEIKKLREEKEMLKQCLDKLMFDADVVNVKINGEVGDYVYVRSDKQFKLNIKD